MTASGFFESKLDKPKVILEFPNTDPGPEPPVVEKLKGVEVGGAELGAVWRVANKDEPGVVRGDILAAVVFATDEV